MQRVLLDYCLCYKPIMANLAPILPKIFMLGISNKKEKKILVTLNIMLNFFINTNAVTIFSSAMERMFIYGFDQFSPLISILS
jgi:hypothetical protein